LETWNEFVYIIYYAFYNTSYVISNYPRCTARNDLLKKERSADIKLVVEVPKEVTSSEPPKFLYSSEADSERTTIVLDEYEDLQLDCIASGIPLPTITWVLTYEPGILPSKHIRCSHSIYNSYPKGGGGDTMCKRCTYW